MESESRLVPELFELRRLKMPLVRPFRTSFGTETVRYGMRATVVALPAPAVFLTPKGLQNVGPRAFGYDLDFKSVFQAPP